MGEREQLVPDVVPVVDSEGHGDDVEHTIDSLMIGLCKGGATEE